MRCIVYNWKKHTGSPEFDPSSPHSARLVVHTCKLSTRDVEAGRLEVQGLGLEPTGSAIESIGCAICTVLGVGFACGTGAGR